MTSRARELAELIRTQGADSRWHRPLNAVTLLDAHVPPYALISPSADPLTLLPELARAVVVLACRGLETTRDVGLVLRLRHPREVRATLLHAAQTIYPATLPPAYPNAPQVATVIPDLTTRACLLLHASGLIRPVDRAAALLHLDRSTYFRRVTLALAVLRPLANGKG